MNTTFIAGQTRVKAIIAREFAPGDAFTFNGQPHVVESVTLEPTHREVHLVEAQIAPTTNRVSHRRRRSRKAYQGAENY